MQASTSSKDGLSLEDLEQITTRIERGLTEMFDREVGSKYIGQLVMDELKGLDQVAYVRFASVYRELKDVQQFIEELRPFLEGPAHAPPGFPSS